MDNYIPKGIAKNQIAKKKKISKSLLGNVNAKGKKWKTTENHKGNLGRHWKMSKETKDNLIKKLTGRILTKEHRLNLSKSHMGELSSCWLGGISFEPYGLEFNKQLKEKVRERDNHLCMECGERQNSYKFPIHHIDYNKRNNEMSNLVTLCRSCHGQTNYERNDWTDYFKSKLALIG